MRWLSGDGLAAAVAVGGAVLVGLGWRGVALLLAFFVSGSALTQAVRRAGERRSARQVVSNGGVAALAALVGAWWVAAGALAAATADTWATEIGALSPRPPRLITTGRPVAAGTSGGITWLGTAAGLGGAVLIAGAAWVLQPRGALKDFLGPFGPSVVAPGLTHPGVLLALVVVAAGVVGMFVDSLLGAAFQGRFACPTCDAEFESGQTVCHAPVVPIRGWQWLDNDGVNLGATLAGAGVAALTSRWLF